MLRNPPFQFELATLMLVVLMTATALGAFGPWGLFLALICGLIVAWGRADTQTGLARKPVAVGALIVVAAFVALAHDSERPAAAAARVSDWLAPLLFAATVAAMLFRPRRRSEEDQEPGCDRTRPVTRRRRLIQRLRAIRRDARKISETEP